MTSALAEPDVLLGAQRPRILHTPEFVSSTGHEAVELAQMAGIDPDPWQEYVIHGALGERADGKWAAFEVGVEVARQNGKGGILEIRALAGLFLLEERLIIHSAHEFATAEEALERMAAIIEGCADLSRRVKAIKRSHGQEGIYLTNGQRLRYRTRTKGGGRGFSADCVILDEAMVIPDAMHGALMPTLSAMPNPQLWYTGSAVDQESMEHGLVFARVRDRALKGEDPSLAYYGWSAPFDRPDEVASTAAADPETWARANPALGIRISAEHIAKEQRSMDPRTFAVERLGVGDWPAIDGEASVIDLATWAELFDEDSSPVDPVAFAVDVRPDRSAATIGVAGRRRDELFHLEVVDRRRGTGWVPERCVELVARHRATGVLIDMASPAASLVPELEKLGVRVVPINARDHARACGLLFDLVEQRQLRHLDEQELLDALRGAAQRDLGDAWAWSRKSSLVDISPLVACTLALWGCWSTPPARKSAVHFL
jgi:hypothetical protein